ncbi:MAG: membrane metalloprotease [Winogradskyella sp.]|nr:membrane metalloprotease [Winogradskyella sp.]MBT8375740.1 membrane metalloprotease [Bacteroidia bacterium]RZW43828.1 MAG: membrane metalloprotease [Flavobacteriaceae bacterium]NNC45076.1 membrane metalloprotease [Winogradskyella sp.]NNF85838.1 membrane metalloprotease [Winogradskyella sp.]
MKRILILCLSVIIVACTTEESNTNTPNVDNTLENKQPTGSSSNDLLSDDTFTSMVLEIVYVDGFEPTQTAINNLVNFIEERSFKPNGITIDMRSIPSPGTSPYTNEDIVTIEDNNRTRYNTNTQIAVWAFFADGQSASNTENSVVLGTAYRNTSFVIYEETIQNLTDGTFGPSQSVLESTVMLHEFGHIYGLTNLGAPLQSDHEDQDNPRHCDVEDCLMYFQSETGSGVMNMVSGGNAPQLDAQCIADLQANGGK